MITKTIIEHIKKGILRLFLFFKKTVKLYVKTKQLALFSLLLFIGTCSCVSFARVASSYLPSNQSVTLRETCEEYKKKNGSLPNGLVYYHQLVDKYEDTVYRNCDISRKMRSIFYNNIFFDIYKSDWFNKYSPGVVNYKDGREVHLTYVMFPKESYIYKSWQYTMPLICSSDSTQSSPYIGTPNDIYINIEFADKLLDDFHLSNYESLLKKQVVIPYSVRYGTSSERKPDLIDATYIIKGVLDSNSDEYIGYKQLFGDFFIVNDFFSLPIPPQTYFNITESETEILLFKTILNNYNYESNRNNFSSVSSSYTFQARVAFFDSEEGNHPIKNIYNSSDSFNNKLNKCFETFAGTIYIIYLVLYALLNIVSFIVSLYSITLFYNKIDMENNKKESIFILFLFIMFALIIGVVLMNVFHGLAKIPLSYNHYIGSIIYIVEIIILTTFVLFYKNKKIIS